MTTHHYLSWCTKLIIKLVSLALLTWSGCPYTHKKECFIPTTNLIIFVHQTTVYIYYHKFSFYMLPNRNSPILIAVKIITAKISDVFDL